MTETDFQLGAKHAWWKGLAMARLQFGLAIVMLNVLKWHLSACDTHRQARSVTASWRISRTSEREKRRSPDLASMISPSFLKI